MSCTKDIVMCYKLSTCVAQTAPQKSRKSKMPLKFRYTKNGTIPVYMPCTKLPSLAGATKIAIDLETKDDGIGSNTGPGGSRGLGYVLGISIATDNRICEYIPLRHPETDNWNIDEVRDWFAKEMDTNAVKLFANCMYDFEWLIADGFTIDFKRGFKNFRDVQFLEPLLDETRFSYSLESLGEKYLPEKWRKVKGHMEEEAKKLLGDYRGDVRAHLWKLPAEAGVGAYAQMDAASTLKVFEAQEDKIRRFKLETVCDMEHRLVPLLLQMRRTGVRVSKKKLQETEALLVNTVEEKSRQLDQMMGVTNFNPKSTKHKEAFYNSLGLPVQRTKAGAPTLTDAIMDSIDHPCVSFIREVNQSKKALEFVESSYRHMHNDHIYCQFHPMKGDRGGTVSGRFSCSTPNLQQQPGKAKPEMGQLIRRCFVPEPYCKWSCNDYSQIEYRFIAYYAARAGLKSGVKALEAYRHDKTIDFHQWVADLCGIKRDDAKRINFGIAFGMGKDKLRASLGVSASEAVKIMKAYDRHAPFVRKIMELISDKAQRTGFVKTILGRRSHFRRWENARFTGKQGKDRPTYSKRVAIKKFGSVKRAFTHKAGNRVIQGSAADLMKMGMVLSFEAGVFDVLIPHLTVHDELDSSAPNNKAGKEANRELVYHMEHALDEYLDMPIMVDAEIGPNWWDVKETKGWT